MKRRKSFRTVEQPHNFWPSFTDLISTVALILFFIILIIYMKQIIFESKTQDTLLQKEKEINQLNDQVSLLNDNVSEKEKNLLSLEEKERETKIALQRQQEELEKSNDEIDKQRDIIIKSNEQLNNMRNRLREIAVLRLDILEKVKKAIQKQLDTANISGTNVSIGSNGNIILQNKLMFGVNSYKISSDGEKLLHELAQVFENVLDDQEISKNIDAINIQGHTDDVDTSEYNRQLSSKRAISVVDHLLHTNKALETKYGKYFVASAYSEFRPIATGNSEASRAQNRRIEISIMLKDSNIQKIIDTYLDDSESLFE